MGLVLSNNIHFHMVRVYLSIAIITNAHLFKRIIGNKYLWMLYSFRLHGLRWAGLMANNSSLSNDDTNNTFTNSNNADVDGGWFDWGQTNLIVDENGFRMHSTNPVIVIGLMVGIFGSFYYGYWGMYQLKA